MKTIEITSGDQKVQFTTTSVTFDGKEFLYSHMTNVIHSTERHIYTFTYDGEVKLLPYDEKDEKTLNAIFSQVQKLAAQKKAAASASISKEDAADPKSGAASENADAVGAAEEAADSQKSEGENKSSEKTTEHTEVSQKTDESSESSDEEAARDASVNVNDVLGKAKSKKAAKKEKAEAAKSEAEKPEEDPEKKARKNKSYKIFGIIIAILLVCSVAYYLIFGTPTAPAPTNPNTTESQQYDDIDQLIDDLQ